MEGLIVFVVVVAVALGAAHKFGLITLPLLNKVKFLNNEK